MKVKVRKQKKEKSRARKNKIPICLCNLSDDFPQFKTQAETIIELLTNKMNRLELMYLYTYMEQKNTAPENEDGI